MYAYTDVWMYGMYLVLCLYVRMSVRMSVCTYVHMFNVLVHAM